MERSISDQGHSIGGRGPRGNGRALLVWLPGAGHKVGVGEIKDKGNWKSGEGGARTQKSEMLQVDSGLCQRSPTCVQDPKRLQGIQVGHRVPRGLVNQKRAVTERKEDSVGGCGVGARKELDRVSDCSVSGTKGMDSESEAPAVAQCHHWPFHQWKVTTSCDLRLLCKSESGRVSVKASCTLLEAKQPRVVVSAWKFGLSTWVRAASGRYR